MRLDRNQAEALLSRMQGRRVAVIGDLMLDEYLMGEVNRISPEAPVPIVRVMSERSVLGGAANVAANLKAIGVEPVLIGTLQNDRAGEQLLQLLVALGIDPGTVVLDPTRSTTIKTRVIGQRQQMLRIDREDSGDVGGEAVEGLRRSLSACLQDVGALIVSDYAKGVITAPVMDAVRDLCLLHGIPWIVDPRPVHRALYQGATLMTPNTKELMELTGLPAVTDVDVARTGRQLAGDLGMAGLLVTRSEKGMALFAPDAIHRDPWFIPTEAQEVSDVTGAGDTVIAVFSAAVAARADWKDAAMLANAAAGIVVGKIGTATATPVEILSHYQDQKAI